MKNIEELKQSMKKWYLTIGILAFALGTLIVIFPAFWIRLIVSVLGIGAVVYGFYNLKFTKELSDDSKYKQSIKIKSIVSIVCGIIAFLFPIAFGATAWTAMTVLLIIYLIGAASIGFYSVALLKNLEIECRKYIIENLVLIAIAVVLILISPKTLGTALVRLVGVVAMVGGAGLIIYEYVLKKKNNEVAEVNVEDDAEGDE